MVELKPIWIQAPNQEPVLELHSMAVPNVDTHHRSVGPDTGDKKSFKTKCAYVFLPVEHMSYKKLGQISPILCQEVWKQVLRWRRRPTL